MKRFHLIAAACALGLIAACGPQEADPANPADIAEGRDSSWRELDADLARNAALGALRKHYPEEYVRFVDEMMSNYAEDIAADPDRTFASHRTEAMASSVDFIDMMIQRDKVYSVNAPVERLQDWMRAYANVVKTIQEQRGDQICSDYVSRGGDALPADTSFMAIAWNDMSAALINAMAEGRAKVKERFPATQEDFDAMTAWAIESGVSEDLIKGVQSGSRTDPASVCEFMIGMTRTLADMPDEAGDRMRLRMMLDILRLQGGEIKVIRNDQPRGQ